MGCRCSDIIRYNNMLSKLNQAAEYVNCAVNNSSTTDLYMNECGKSFAEGIILNQAEISIGEELKNGYKDTISDISNAQSEVKTAIQNVKEKLSSCKSEDKSWHNRKKHK